MLDGAERERMAVEGKHAAVELEARGVAVVALTWVDTSGVTRVKAVPTSQLGQVAAYGVGASPVFDAFLLDDSIVSGRYAGGPVGDLRLHPDLTRLTILASQPGWAWAPVDRFDQDGRPHPADVRLLLRREVARLAADGLSARAAFEVEWVVSPAGTPAPASPGPDPDPDPAPFVAACRGPAYGMTRLVELSDYTRDVVTALAAEGVVVMQLHPEYAAGQFEVSVAAEDPVGAADTVVLVKETVRATSARHGLGVSFSPAVVAGAVGNGGHVHLSLWAGGNPENAVNLMAGGDGPCGLTGTAAAFTAGILAHLPALLALGAPSVASYLRLVPSHWAGVFACWGVENREAALRLIRAVPGERDTAANIEVKCVDLAANPYLLLAGLLAAGRAGIAAGQVLPEQVDVDPASLTDTERVRRGIHRLPASLGAALAAFLADDVLPAALGEQLADTVAAVRKGEIALFADATAEQVAAATRWRH